MSEKKRILVTSALPYANGPLHLGHAAGAYLPADIYCRFRRLEGHDLVYICGSDEHGVPIMLRAREEGVSPQEVVDRYHAMLEQAFEALGMSFDHYGRTSSAIHRETSQAFFRTMADKGLFVTRKSSQLYDPEAKLFLADRFVRGTCPTCGYEDAYGDQCEKCGRTLSPAELIEPRSAITDAVPELRETVHWYLPLGEHQAWLEGWIESREGWKTNVLGQIKSWLTDGLAERAMTRDLPWGVPLPPSVAQKEGVDPEGKVLYVWFDAPIGYVSATREWAARKGDPELWKRYWQDEETSLVHFIGKDNIVFHTVIFPIMLKLHGDYVLPENVPANEFLNLEGQKISTSRGWAVWVHEALEDFPADYLRYSLLRLAPETKDSDFSWADFQAHINNELADNLGNFLKRSAGFAERFFDNKVPELGELTEDDRALLEAMAEAPAKIGELLAAYRFRDALMELMGLSRHGNKYFNDQAPWATRKSDPARCQTTLHLALQLSATLSVLSEPFLPTSAARARAMLGLTGVRSSAPGGAEAAIGWAEAGQPLLEAGASLGASEVLFQKIEDAAIEAQRKKLADKAAAAAAAKAPEGGPYTPKKENIVYDDFAKLDLRLGKVVAAERVPKSKKLLRTEVDLGFERRQILAGVAEHIEPEALIGKTVVVVANLAPRKMMGLMSEGMLLMSEDRAGKLIPVSGESEPGSTVT